MKRARRDKAFHRKTARPTVFPCRLHQEYLKLHTVCAVRPALQKTNRLFAWGYLGIWIFCSCYSLLCHLLRVLRSNTRVGGELVISFKLYCSARIISFLSNLPRKDSVLFLSMSCKRD